jgi:hypothetical protein
MRPLGFQFSVGGLFALTPWPIGQVVLHVNLQVVLDQIIGPLLLPPSYRVFLVYISSIFTEHQFGFMDTWILMVLDIPQGDPVLLSRHC